MRIMSQPHNNLPFIINVGNSIIGVTILAMPFCFQQCGIVLGSLMLFFSTWLTIKSCQLLVKAGVVSRKRSFSLLAYSTHGATGKLFVEICMIGLQLGTLVAQVVIIGDLGPAIVSKATGFENTDNLRTSLIVCLCLFVGLPLGLLKDLRTLSKASTMCILFYTFFTFYVFLQSFPNLYEGTWYRKIRLWRVEGFFQCLPIFSFAFGCQTQLFIVYNAMADPSLKRINSIIKSAVLLCMVAYLLVAFFGYIAFSNEKELTGDIINHFHENGLSDAIKLCFVISIAVSIPLIVYPCRTSLYTLLFPQKPKEDVPGSAKIPEQHFQVITAAIIVGAMVTGILVPNVEFVLGLTGATMGSLICYIFPALFFIHVMSESSEGRFISKIVLISGLTVLIASTYTTLNPREKTPEIISLDKDLRENVAVDHSKPVDKKELVEDVKKEADKVDLEVKNKPPDGVEGDSNQSRRQEPPIPQAPDEKEEIKDANKDKIEVNAEKEFKKDGNKEKAINGEKDQNDRDNKDNRKENPDLDGERLININKETDNKNRKDMVDIEKVEKDDKDKEEDKSKKVEEKDKVDELNEEKKKEEEKMKEEKIKEEKEKEEKLKKEEEEKKKEEERKRIEAEKKQEEILNKLEQQQEEQEKLIQEQKEILEELKQHKDEHKEQQDGVQPIQDLNMQQVPQIQGQIQNQGILQPAVAQVPIQQLQGQVDLQQQIIHQNQFVNQQANLLGQPQNQPLMQQPAVNQQGMDQGVQGVDQNAFHNVVQNVPQNPGLNVVQNVAQNIGQMKGVNVVQSAGQNAGGQNPVQNFVQNVGQNLEQNNLQNVGQNIEQKAGQGHQVVVNQQPVVDQFENPVQLQNQQHQVMQQQFFQQPVMNQADTRKQQQINTVNNQQVNNAQEGLNQEQVPHLRVDADQQGQNVVQNVQNNVLKDQPQLNVNKQEVNNLHDNPQAGEKLSDNTDMDVMKHRGKRELDGNSKADKIEPIDRDDNVNHDLGEIRGIAGVDNNKEISENKKLIDIEGVGGENENVKHVNDEGNVKIEIEKGSLNNNGQRDLKMFENEKMDSVREFDAVDEDDYVGEALKALDNKLKYNEGQRLPMLDVQDTGKLRRR